jgi:hypothetical protein
MIVKNCLAIRLECPSPFTLLLVISTEMDTSMNALEKRPNAQHLQRDENGYQETLPRQEERPEILSCNHECAGRNRLLHPKTRVSDWLDIGSLY